MPASALPVAFIASRRLIRDGLFVDFIDKEIPPLFGLLTKSFDGTVDHGRGLRADGVHFAVVAVS